jgi:hypothetical protein
MFIIGLVATVMSVVGYLIISNIKASTSLKIRGFYIRLVAALLFFIYTIINKDFSVFILTLFYTVIDAYNLYNLINMKRIKHD